MKTKEELNAIKEEIKSMNKKLAELTEEELEQVIGGRRGRIEIEECCPLCDYVFKRSSSSNWVARKYNCPNCNVFVSPRIKEIEVDPRICPS